MKTTSYEISKQLQKNGLSKLNGESKLGFLEYYYNTDKQLRHRYQESYCSTDKENTQVDCFAYDLETILEALPESVKFDNKWAWFEMDKNFIIYEFTDEDNTCLFDFHKQENESLADTAARLLILLHEKGLINFNYVQDQKESILKERQRKNKAF